MIKLKRKSQLYSEAEGPDDSGPPVETRVPLLPPSDPDEAPQSQTRFGSRMAEKKTLDNNIFSHFYFPLHSNLYLQKFLTFVAADKVINIHVKFA